jgi:trans,polycis-polyprenyl diphosphate synthase
LSKTTRAVRPPDPHPSGARPPAIPREFVPRHVALVMDGDGRWAKKRGLPRTEGHKEGESSLLDVIMGAIELGVPYLSAYAFSTENWRRSPDEVRFLMGFNRDVIHRRRDLLNDMGVRIRWAGRRPRLWRSVIRELETAEQMSAENTVLTLQFCVNYGGRAEIVDAAAAIAADVAAGKLRAGKVDEKVFARYLDEPGIPEVDLFVRSSGEQRLSNFLLWQSAYAELVFLDTLWPDFDRRHLWHACEIYATRDRRYGGAIPNPVAEPNPDAGMTGLPGYLVAWSAASPTRIASARTRGALPRVSSDGHERAPRDRSWRFWFALRGAAS